MVAASNDDLNMRAFVTFIGTRLAVTRSRVLLGVAALATVFALGPAAVDSADDPSVTAILANYLRAIADPGVRAATKLETAGTIEGAGLAGIFHTWVDGDRERDEQSLGPRTDTTVRVGDRVYDENSDGNVRRFSGIMLRRTRTEVFIDSGDFARAPEHCVARGRAVVGGREAYALDVTAPGGETQTLYLDASTWLPLRIAYDEDDGRRTVDLSDWRTVEGRRYPFLTVSSDGDRAFDVTQKTAWVAADRAIDQNLFEVPKGHTIDMAAPQTIALTLRDGHLFAPVEIAGKHYTFLVDTGAQSILIDSRVAREAGLTSEGALEASGAQRTGGLGVARLATLGIGNGKLHDLVVTTLDLGRSTEGAFPIDGLLGYPFFAEATVTLDTLKPAMTFGPPGSFKPAGNKIAIEIDREFPEASFRVNRQVTAPFIVDTGSAAEVLLYRPFVDAHAGLVPATLSSRRSYGIGGAAPSYHTSLDVLELGGFELFHADADVMLATRGAFADRFDAGNVGIGVLKNFSISFDYDNDAMYVQSNAAFNDGRHRN